MKINILLLLSSIITTVYADASPATSESDSKNGQKNSNAIPVNQKLQPTYYSMPLVQNQPQLVQYLQRTPYTTHPQQATAMVIIAQPALIPQHLLYGAQAQQLLQYFHNNPQARYQFMYGYQPQPSPQTYVAQGSQPYTQYIQPVAQYLQPVPQQQIAPSAQPQQYNSNYVTPQTVGSTVAPVYSQQVAQHNLPSNTLNHIAQYAALAAQQHTAPIKTAPPIITGFENFTPEQQAQIKEQLSSHFGTNLTPLSGNTVQATSQFVSKYPLSSPDNTNSQDKSKQEYHQQVSASNYNTQYTKIV